MAWTRIDDSFYENIKVQKAGPIATHLYVSALIYSNKFMTDGFISEEIIPVIAPRSFVKNSKREIAKLLESGLWHKVEGGYQINDFLDFNKSREEIEEINKKRAIAGAKGGSKNSKDIKQSAKQNDKQDAKQTDEQTLSINPNTLIPLYPKEEKDLNSSREKTLNAGNIFEHYQNLFGILSAAAADRLKSLLEDYPELWVIEALKIASQKGVRRINYVEGILRSWHDNGFKPSDDDPTFQPIDIFKAVTGMPAIPGSEQSKVATAMRSIRDSKALDDDALTAYLKPYFEAWISRKSKSGKPYSPANCTWLYDWAVAGHIPDFIEPEKPKGRILVDAWGNETEVFD